MWSIGYVRGEGRVNLAQPEQYYKVGYREKTQAERYANWTNSA